jgi:hypothetical protein
VAGRVVQIAGDPGSLLGDGEQALALRVLLGAQRTLSELGDLLAPQPRSLPGEPGDRPGETNVD